MKNSKERERKKRDEEIKRLFRTTLEIYIIYSLQFVQ